MISGHSAREDNASNGRNGKPQGDQRRSFGTDGGREKNIRRKINQLSRIPNDNTADSCQNRDNVALNGFKAVALMFSIT